MKNNTKLRESLSLLARSSIIVFIGIFLSKLLIYIYRIIVARYFGADVYGLLSLSTVLLGFFIAVASLGLTEGMVRYISVYRGKKEEHKIQYLFQTCYTFLLVSSIFTGIILFILANTISINLFHEPRLVNFLRILSLVIPFTILSGPYLSLLRGYEKISSYSFIYNIIQNGAKLVFLIALVLVGFSSDSVPISYLAGIVVMFIASYAIAHKKLSNVFIKSVLSKSKKTEVNRAVFSYSWPLLFFGVVSLLFSWIDTFMLGYYKGVTEVGLYNAAVPIALLLMIIPELFMQLFFPLITRHYADGSHSVARDVAKQVGKWILVLTLPIAVLLIAYPENFIRLLFGAEYIPASQALRLMAIGNTIWAIALVSHNILSVVGKSKKILYNFIYAAFLNIILNAILIPKYSMSGAAFATMVSYIFLSLLFIYQSYNLTKIVPFKRESWKILLAGLIAAIILFLTKSYLDNFSNFWFVFWIIIIFDVVYVLNLIWVFRALDDEDWAIINKISGKMKHTIRKPLSFK